MDIGALLTSAGINIAVCVVLLSLYSILRKQPSNVSVYFMRRLISEPIKHSDPFRFERLVPSASWIVRAWQATNEEILAAGGVDALVFLRIVVFRWLSFSRWKILKSSNFLRENFATKFLQKSMLAIISKHLLKCFHNSIMDGQCLFFLLLVY